MMDQISPSVERWLKDAAEEPDYFWGEAAEELPWFRKWDKAFEWQPPTFRWLRWPDTPR